MHPNKMSMQLHTKGHTCYAKCTEIRFIQASNSLIWLLKIDNSEQDV